MRQQGTVAASLVLALVVAGCGAVGIADPATGKPPYTAPPPTPTLTPAQKPTVVAHGTPYAAADILAALAASDRVPAALRTDDVAAAVAEALASQLTTYDGRPYAALTLSASCDDGGARCDLQAKGVPAFAPDRDTADFYTFAVDLGTGVVLAAGEPALRGFPPDLVPSLDAAVQSSLGDRLAGTTLLAAHWVPPPAADAYLLRYGTGDEEADEQLIVRYDRATDSATIVAE